MQWMVSGRGARRMSLIAVPAVAVGLALAQSAGAKAAHPASAGGAVHILAWAGEVPQNIVSQFEKRTGVKVTVDTVTSNEAMIAKLAAGGSGYNVIEPSQYAVQILASEKLVQPLVHSKLVGMNRIISPFTHASYDPGNKYSLPWTWGSTGLIYNSKCTGTVNSWSVLWNAKYKGKLYMLDNELSAYIPALQVNGYHANSTVKAQIQKATQSLVTQKPLLAGYNSDNYAQLVASGQACAAEAYSGGTTATAVASNKNVHYILPKEGGTVWVDSFSIPKSASDLTDVYKWLNFVLEPKVAAKAALAAQEATANKAAYHFVPKKLLNNPAVYTPVVEVKRADFILNPGKALAYFNQGWLQVRS